MRGIGLSNKDAVLLWSMVLLVSMASVGAASDWPQFQKNETNFGCTDDKAPLGVNFAWRAPTNSAVDVVPVVGDDSVFILPKNNRIYSVNTTTGVRNWRTSTALNTGTGPWTNALSTPAYDEGNNSLYVATAGANLSIWNFTSSEYELLQPGADTSDEVTLAGEKTSGISSYINSGNITVLAQQKSAQSGYNLSYIETDYVKVIITTT